MMTWRPIDFEGIISIEKPLYEQLDQFLYEKEGSLGECIMYSIHIVGDKPQLPAKAIFRLKLSEALENFEKRIRQLAVSQETLPTMKDFNTTISDINNGLWKYVETLENCVKELFQQLDQTGLEKWHKEMSSVVGSIKVMLMHRLEDVSWAIRRMETLLWKYREICTGDKSFWINIKQWLPWSHLLDKKLLPNIEKSKKYLSYRYKKFADRMLSYNKFYEKIDQSIQKFQSYHVYKTLDTSDKEKFKHLYELLKLWEFNLSSKSLPSQDIVRAIRQIQSEEKMYEVFNNYYHALKDKLYHQANLFKLSPKLWEDSEGKKIALDAIASDRQETHTLGSIILKYRDFLLRTDPNPYVSSRWGFGEWIVGQEPAQSKRLLNLSYEVESLDSLFEKSSSFMKETPEQEENLLRQASHQINQWLHELSQPLISRTMIHRYVENIMDILANLNELGSFSKDIMNFVGKVLSKTLRADWRYNVSFGIPKFKEVYQIHMGLMDSSEDRKHLSRKNKFKQILQEIEDWAKKRVAQKHIQEIEQDMSDIKITLQDFLAYVQRTISAAKPEDTKTIHTRQEIERQLLEYRYQFGQFFYHLSQYETEGRSLLNQFLFVHQYFETIENQLNKESKI